MKVVAGAIKNTYIGNGVMPMQMDQGYKSDVKKNTQFCRKRFERVRE